MSESIFGTITLYALPTIAGGIEGIEAYHTHAGLYINTCLYNNTKINPVRRFIYIPVGKKAVLEASELNIYTTREYYNNTCENKKSMSRQPCARMAGTGDTSAHVSVHVSQVSDTNAHTGRKKRGHEVFDYITPDELAVLAAKTCATECCDYIAYTDGSGWAQDPCRCGGSAYVIIDHLGHVVKTSCRGFMGTTSNRMEMLAIISAVNSTPEGSSLAVFSDSMYAINMFTYTDPKKTRGVCNHDLLDLYFRLAKRLKKITLTHVRGHVGIPLNDWCDYWSHKSYLEAREKCKQML